MDQLSIFEAMTSSHIPRLNFQSVHCYSFWVWRRPRFHSKHYNTLVFKFSPKNEVDHLWAIVLWLIFCYDNQEGCPIHLTFPAVSECLWRPCYQLNCSGLWWMIWEFIVLVHISASACFTPLYFLPGKTARGPVFPRNPGFIWSEYEWDFLDM